MKTQTLNDIQAYTAKEEKLKKRILITTLDCFVCWSQIGTKCFLFQSLLMASSSIAKPN